MANDDDTTTLIDLNGLENLHKVLDALLPAPSTEEDDDPDITRSPPQTTLGMFPGLLKEIICKALPLPVDDKSLSEVLHQVGLGKLAARIHDHDRWGDILSSGEKQRIALARLILRRPKWIFLDETTSHLEEQEAIRLLRLVREKLPTSGVIMVTHQPGVWNLADDICDISAVL